MTIKVQNTRYVLTRHAKRRLETRFFKRKVSWRKALEFVIGWQNRMSCVWVEKGNKKILVTCYPKELTYVP